MTFTTPLRLPTAAVAVLCVLGGVALFGQVSGQEPKATATPPAASVAPADGTISTPWGGPLSIAFVPDDATKPEGPGRLAQVYQRMDLRWCQQIVKVAPTYEGFQALSVNGNSGGACADRPDNTVEVVTRVASRP